jgi:hypothetical protein
MVWVFLGSGHHPVGVEHVVDAIVGILMADTLDDFLVEPGSELEILSCECGRVDLHDVFADEIFDRLFGHRGSFVGEPKNKNQP